MADKGQQLIFKIIRWVTGLGIGALGYLAPLLLLSASIWLNHGLYKILIQGYNLTNSVSIGIHALFYVAPLCLFIKEILKKIYESDGLLDSKEARHLTIFFRAALFIYTTVIGSYVFGIFSGYIQASKADVFFTVVIVITTMFMDMAAGIAAYPTIKEMFPDINKFGDSSKKVPNLHENINKRAEKHENHNKSKDNKGGGDNGKADNP